MAFAEWLNDTVLWAVPHRQIVLAVPKMLRPYFRYDRRLLGDLCRVASRVITKSFRALTGRADITVGMVACVQTFGNFANFHPINYSSRRGSVIYRTKMVDGPNRNFQIYDPLDFLAAVTAHIPDRREHLVRYYGWYSSVQRGKRRKQGLESKLPEAPPIEDDTPCARAARRAWSRLIRSR